MLPRVAPSAERTPISLTAFGNTARDDAIDTRPCERQGDDAEELEQRQGEAAVGRRSSEQLIHRRHAQDRLILVDRPDRLLDRGRETSRVGMTPDDE